MTVQSRIIAVCLLISACSAQEIPYDMGNPYKQLDLSEELNEISGLTMDNDLQLAAVQDEKGIIYFLETTTGDIADRFDFGKDGDYEGIAQDGARFYVLRSDGRIILTEKGRKNREYKLKDDKKDFDFEGLCLDRENKRLLMACKTHGNKDKRDHFYIYSFSLKNKEYDKKPWLKMKRNVVHRNFSPSAIAVHPGGTIYVLSSYSKTLLVISDEGKILSNQQLNKRLFTQPEGITFSKEGDLFISNEKNGGKANILWFKPVHLTE